MGLHRLIPEAVVPPGFATVPEILDREALEVLRSSWVRHTRQYRELAPRRPYKLTVSWGAVDLAGDVAFQAADDLAMVLPSRMTQVIQNRGTTFSKACTGWTSEDHVIRMLREPVVWTTNLTALRFGAA